MKLLPAPILALALFVGSLVVSVEAAPLELLTPAEAAQANLPVVKEEKPALDNVPSLRPEVAPALGAPQIFVDTPAPGVAVTAPFPVKIRFVPSSGAKIDLDSLKVDVLKLIPISLLSRVRPYLTTAGINVPEAKIPAGTYNVRVVVADDQGREGTTVQMWTVH